ncbi:aspartyl-phosphate phosphatase Spo0E family protein [Hydrogenispora ethanolica]|uniref:aspartyl-phosphate phosphatase Spo0E family protein n=1 Tax=Hydrogenispora ethanolica TaxID=1082276 RepID=UPI001FB3C9B3|nr:aspartyl-phosphate phosphatase Spo0E family protein [Hydrogenispora ethanolica]
MRIEVSIEVAINTDTISLQMLYERIELLRDRMQQLWNEKGYTDPEVLNASIELDGLLNEYHRRVAAEGRR